MVKTLALMTFLALAAHAACAAEATPVAPDSRLEQRVTALAEELRCLVCQNQSLADSHAPLAIDLKNQVRDKLQAGWTERQIVDYMVERYGDFVRYRPPIKPTTLLLWFGPPLLLLAGLGVLLRRLARRGAAAPPPSNEGVRERAAQLLGEAMERPLS